jgi:hypothetical protein
MEENRDSTQIYGTDTYFKNLQNTYVWFSDYTNVAHPSEPNYIWLEAAQDFGLTTDNDPSSSNSTASTAHLVTYLKSAGKTWRSYQEGLPNSTSCGISSSGNYAAKHNPFVFFQDVVGSYASPSSYCTSHIVDFSQLATDIANNNLANYIEITPNLCNDGHDCANASVETFLQNSTMTAVFNYVLNPANHAILIVEWDESESTNLLATFIVAPPSTLNAAHQVTTNVSHNSNVRSVQEIFAVDPAHGYTWLAGASGANDFSSAFAKGQFP